MSEPIFRDSIVSREGETTVPVILAPRDLENGLTLSLEENVIPAPAVTLDGATTDNSSSLLVNIAEVPAIGQNGLNNTSVEERRAEESLPPSYDNMFAITNNDLQSSFSSTNQNNSSSSKKLQAGIRRASKKVPSLSGEGGVLEKMFGETKATSVISKRIHHDKRGSSTSTNLAHKVLQRKPLNSAHKAHNNASGEWIVMIDSKASSFSTEAEANAAYEAHACPTMHSFIISPNCYICESKFAVFRRACHCRNCGVCICSHCSTTWPSSMIPSTFNIKSVQTVKICIACDWLSHSFREALLSGNHDETLALYTTGNVNLRTPFANVKGEIFQPVHAAVMGKNIKIFRWLLDYHYCPICITNTPKQPILTSERRSVIDIAMKNNDIDILRYLIVEKNASVYGCQDLQTALHNLNSVIRLLPPCSDNHSAEATAPLLSEEEDHMNYCLPEAEIILPEAKIIGKTDFDVASLGDNACIICYENEIDCVITPCGHQICCMHCSTNISTCPLCNVTSQFIRTYRP